MNPIVAAARGWIGTPYLHQASVRGVGADCLGLVRGIWREVYGAEPEAVPAYTQDWAEPRQVEVLATVADRHLLPVTEASTPRPGELLLFRMREAAVAKHLGIVATDGEAPTFIHAYSGHGVVENSLSIPWFRRVAARYEFPTTSSGTEG